MKATTPAPAERQPQPQASGGSGILDDRRPQALAMQRLATLASQSRGMVQMRQQQSMLDTSAQAGRLQALAACLQPPAKPRFQDKAVLQGLFVRNGRPLKKLPPEHGLNSTIDDEFKSLQESDTPYEIADDEKFSRVDWVRSAQENTSEEETEPETKHAVTPESTSDDDDTPAKPASGAAKISIGGKKVLIGGKKGGKLALADAIRDYFDDRRFPAGVGQAFNALYNAPTATVFDNEQALADSVERSRKVGTGKGKNGKKDAESKPDHYQDRVAGTAIGTEVDISTHPKFRMERRLRRRYPAKGLNYYVTKNTLENGETAWLATVSQPSGSLPPEEASMTPSALAARTLIGHSEEQTDRIEKKYSVFRNAKRVSEATTREQCKDCRHNFPSKVKAKGGHVFGSQYSAPENHLPTKALRDRIRGNKGKAGKLKLTPAEHIEFRRGADSATYARRQANKTLNDKIAAIEKESTDSSGSDDEGDIYLHPNIIKGRKPRFGAKGTLGKSRIHVIPDSEVMSNAERKEQETWVAEQRKKAAVKKRVRDAAAAEEAAEDADTEEDEEAVPRRGQPAKKKRG